MSLGLAIACSTVIFASDSIQALLFPASFEINGSNIGLNNDYKVLNVDGHAYVPIRFIAENLGATIDYDAESEKIFVKNKILDLTDPDYKDISVGNLILTKDGNNTKVTGQLKMAGVGSSKNKIEAKLAFYNDKSEKIGDIAISGNDFGVESQTFVSEGAGDFRAYSAVNLRIGAVNDHIISELPSVLYENTKYNFTLKLPKTWEGRYEVEEKVIESEGFRADNYNFIDKANKGYGGVVFTITVWTKEDWLKNGPSLIGVGQIYKIGEDGDKVFTLAPPGDVEYNPHDEMLKAEFFSMYDHINTIKTTFKLTPAPSLVGYITKHENQRALVVSPISREINQTRKEFYDAIWVSNMPQDVEVGQYVHVWLEGAIATSYPGQGKASKVTITKIQKPEKAILSQDEVIRKALLNKDISSINNFVINEVVYDENSDVWTIRYKSAIITDSLIEEHIIQVPDK